MSGDAIFSDAQHEGHVGWVADGGSAGISIASNVYNFLEANPADIVLLHIGTKDVSGGHASADDVRLILDEIDRYSPSVWVVLTLIINRATPPCALCTTTTVYNDALDAMVRTRLNDKIVIVDTVPTRPSLLSSARPIPAAAAPAARVPCGRQPHQCNPGEQSP